MVIFRDENINMVRTCLKLAETDYKRYNEKNLDFLRKSFNYHLKNMINLKEIIEDSENEKEGETE